VLLNEIAAFLSTVTGLTTVDIRKGGMPATPDVVMVVSEYGGSPPDLGFGVSGIQYEHPGLQITCRGVAYDYMTPRGYVVLAYQALSTVQGTVLSGTLYHLIRPVQTPFLMNRDENQRCVFACNFDVEKVPS